MRSLLLIVVTTFLTLAAGEISAHDDSSPTAIVPSSEGESAPPLGETQPAETTQIQASAQPTAGAEEAPSVGNSGGDAGAAVSELQATQPTEEPTPTDDGSGDDDFSISPEDIERCGGPCPTKRPPKPTCTGDCQSMWPSTCMGGCGDTSTVANYTSSISYATSTYCYTQYLCDTLTTSYSSTFCEECDTSSYDTSSSYSPTYCEECETLSSSSSTSDTWSSSSYECPDECIPTPPTPTYCDECETTSTSYTSPPYTYKPPRPTCSNDCLLTMSIPQPPKPTQACPPRPDCQSSTYKRFYKFGYQSGSRLVDILTKGYEDCANVASTAQALQDKAPSYPTTLDASRSLYCRQLGVYTGFVDAVNQFEKKCSIKCRDDGKQIGSEAAYLLCNLPTARLARLDLCEISFDAGCALAFEETIRTYCPDELSSDRYNQVKDQVCAFKGPQTTQ